MSRQFRGLLIGVAALVAALALAACGGDDEVGGGSDADVETAQPGAVSGELDISTWVGYIDKGEGNTIAEFPWLSVGIVYLPIPIGGLLTLLFIVEKIWLGEPPKDDIMYSDAPAELE